MDYKQRIIPFISALLLLLLSGHASAFAATIRVTPASGNYSVGDNFSAEIVVNGQGTAFNAAKTQVSVSSNLSVESLSLGNCNFAFVATPLTTNPSFTGVILGDSSTACTAYTLNLKAVSSGTGLVTFSNGSIKAYPNGNEIFSSFTDGSYSLQASSVPEATVTPTPPGTSGTGSSASIQSTEYDLELTLLDENNNPIPDAVVTVNGTQQVTSDSEGKVMISNVPGGVNTIKAATKDGRPIAEQVVNLTGDSPVITLGLTEQKEKASQFPLAILIATLVIGGIIGLLLFIRNQRTQKK